LRRIRSSGAHGLFRGLAGQSLWNVMQLVLDWPWLRPMSATFGGDTVSPLFVCLFVKLIASKVVRVFS